VLFGVGVYSAVTLTGDWRSSGLKFVIIGLGAAGIGFLIARLFQAPPDAALLATLDASADANVRRISTNRAFAQLYPGDRPARGPNDGFFLIEVVDDIALGEPEDAKSLSSGSKLHYLPALLRLGWLPPSRECPRHEK
jgi:hypothetical protein